MRAYESRFSIFLRFCDLNNLSVRKGIDALNWRPDRPSEFPNEEIERLAATLGEPVSIVGTAIRQCLSLNKCGSYSLDLQDRSEFAIRVCPECAKFGYHSVFHEAIWLALCPFHAMPLQVAKPHRHCGTILEGCIVALRNVMRTHCEKWPLVESGPADDGLREVPSSILAWVTHVTEAATQYSNEDIFIYHTSHVFERAPYAQKLGQLYAIEPPTDLIKPYLRPAGMEWQNEQKVFDDFLEFFGNGQGWRVVLWRALDFFVQTGALSLHPPPFVDLYNRLVAPLRERHATCCCRWFGIPVGGDQIFWQECEPDAAKYHDARCPYEVALDELDFRWGRWAAILKGRRAGQEFGRLICIAQDLLDRDFVRLVNDRDFGTEPNFKRMQETFGHYVWNLDAPTLDLFNTATEWQMSMEVEAVTAWLGRIDVSNRPGPWTLPSECVRIQRKGDRLLLMRWIRRESADQS
ncbi:hypothetical protein [Burkholderia multivorans]|uniref:hypothetical protein n=1 Tax=Burkholderia multivorans TaxID=87883 RepID=UPI001FC85BEF|nr:hypothetical protein [Burkholderia multivorans]